MFADAICVGNKLAAGPAGTSALAQTFCAAELPVLPASRRYLRTDASNHARK